VLLAPADPDFFSPAGADPADSLDLPDDSPDLPEDSPDFPDDSPDVADPVDAPESADAAPEPFAFGAFPPASADTFRLSFR
jgi:hypothetical protein